MPIYEYRCTSCGHEQEFLQKLSDPAPTRCPKCSQESLTKMVTAAGFQLKGSGWYATDFKGGSRKGASGESSKSEAKSDAKSDGKSEAKSDAKGDTKGTSASSADAAPSSAPAAKAGG